MSNKAAVIHEKGTPDVFRWEEWPVGEPGPGEALIRHGAIGVNYIDTYNRRGMPHPWPVPPNFPSSWASRARAPSKRWATA